jgi:hypothetical protein
VREIALLVLQGPRVELTVRWSPAPSLHFRDPSRDVQLDEVASSETELGTVLVAALEPQLTLTLAIPPLRFPAGRDVLPVTTFAVLTLRRAEGEGALARYTVVHLHGSAHTVSLRSRP